MGTGILVVGEGGDAQFLAEHLEAAGYGVASVNPGDAVTVIGSLRPFAVLVAPRVPEWQRAYLYLCIKAQYPEVKVVTLRKRSEPVCTS